MPGNSPSALPHSPEDDARAKEREREKVQRASDEEQDLLSIDILQTVTTQIGTNEEKIRVKNEELQKAVTQREGWRQDAEIYAKKDLIVRSLETELVTLRATVEKLKSQQGIVRGRITYIQEKLPKGRTEIDAKDLQHTIWYPALFKGKAVESSSPVPGAGTILREKVDGNDAEYLYRSLVEDGSDAYIRVYAPGQKPPQAIENIFGESFEEKEDQGEKLTIVSLLQKSRAEKEAGIRAMLKNDVQKEEVKQWATDQNFFEAGSMGLEMKQAIFAVLADEKHPFFIEAGRIWKERLSHIGDGHTLVEGVHLLIPIGPEQLMWVLEAYEENVRKGDVDQREVDVMGTAILGSATPDKAAIDALQKRFAASKNSKMQDFLLVLRCKNEPGFKDTVSSEKLLDAVRNNKVVVLECLSLFLERRDPRLPEIFSIVMNRHFYYEADTKRYVDVFLQVTEYIATLPEAERLRVATTCNDVMKRHFSMEPLLVNILHKIGHPEKIPVFSNPDFAKMTKEELYIEIEGRLAFEKDVEQAQERLKKMSPEEREELKQREQQQLKQNKEQVAQNILQDILNDAEQRGTRAAERLARESTNLLTFLRPWDSPFPQIPIQIEDNIEALFLAAYKKIEWDDSMVNAVLTETPDVTITGPMKKAISSVLDEVFGDERLRPFGIMQGMKREWFNAIALDPSMQEDVLRLMECGMSKKLAQGDEHLEKIARDSLLRMMAKKEGPDEAKQIFLKFFGRNAAARQLSSAPGNDTAFSRLSGIPYSAAPLPFIVPAVESVAEKSEPVPVISTAIASTQTQKEEQEVEEKKSPALKPLLENVTTVSEGSMNISRGIVDGYAIAIAEDDVSTRAFLQVNNEMLELPTPDVSGLNTVVIDQGNQSTVFYNLEKQQIEDPYDKKQDEILQDIFEIDTRTKVVQKNQIDYISDGMHLLFRDAAGVIGSEHPLRALGIITDDDKLDQKRANQFRELFRYHMDEIRDWTFADMLALTAAWEREGKFVFVPLVSLRGKTA